MDTKTSLKHFFSPTGVPDSWAEKLRHMDEAELTRLDKEMKRGKISGNVSRTVGIAAAPVTLGASLVGSAVGFRKSQVNGQRIEMIKKRLQEEGWKGHEKSYRDYVAPLLMSSAGLLVGGIGVDGVLDGALGGGGGGGGAPGAEGVAPSEPPSNQHIVDLPGGEEHNWHNAVGGAVMSGMATANMATSERAELSADKAREIERRRRIAADRERAPNVYFDATGGREAPLPNHHGDCLALLEIGGWDIMLNDRARLLHYIKQSDGNVECVKTWIEQYVAAK